MSTVAIPNGSAPRPGFFRVVWEVIVGCVLAGFVLLLPIVGLAYLGVFAWNTSSFRDWPLRGPYPPDGLWAVSADLFCAAVVIAVATMMIAGSLETMVKLPVSRPVVALVVVTTGVAPFFYVQLLPASGPAALLFAAFLIRRFAIDRFPQVRIRLSRWVVLAAVAAAGGLALTAGFGVTHPLWATNAYTDEGGRISFTLQNAGLADVTVLGLSEPARLTYPVSHDYRRPRVDGLVLRKHKGRSVVLLTRGCAPDDLRVRYRVFGRVMSVRLRPKPATLRC